MFTKQDTQRIRGMVAARTGQPVPEAQVTEGDRLRVDWAGDIAQITAPDRNALARGYFLLARAAKEGRPSLHVAQDRGIPSCGAMIDMSRNAVMTVEAVKRVLDMHAMLGLNLLLLYTEDTYTVPEAPYLGYLRGRYTPAELRELDDYAASLDIELMPCIQTLGHMSQFLQWSGNGPLRDQPDILLADHPETYTFIEHAVRSLRACMRAKRIHIGMDEAHGVGLGRYYDKHGPTDRFELLNRHLTKVCGICEKYDFHPIMWSDMFFCLGSETNDYYDVNAVIPQQVIDMIPDVDLCYWDYYHMDETFYDHMFREHARMGRTVFAGGVWTWSGFLPQVKRTDATMRPALRSCIRSRVDTVIATMWGDDGAETNVLLAFNRLPIFSETCWQGVDVSDEEIGLAGECLTGIPDVAFRLFGEFYPDERDCRPGKGLIWCDPLYPMMNLGWEPLTESVRRFRGAEEGLRAYGNLAECRFAALCFRVAAAKGEMIAPLRSRYLAGDRECLTRVAEELIPTLMRDYRELADAHRALWERDNKRFGVEILSLRYGGTMERLRDVQEELRRYLAGAIACIEELEAEPLPANRRYDVFYAGFASPMAFLSGC